MPHSNCYFGNKGWEARGRRRTSEDTGKVDIRNNTDSVITLTFDSTPEDLTVNAKTAKVSGDTVEISGPFPSGPLKLELTWVGGNLDLDYTVEAPLTEIGGIEGVEFSGTQNMVLIPEGEFQMGTDTGGFDEGPEHTVYLDAFYIDKTEVTNAQYKEFVLANPWWQKERLKANPLKHIIGHPFVANRPGTYLRQWDGNNYPDGTGDHPVTVPWYAAVAYAEWVGKRLPTEAEWEKAARGGLVGKRFPWGDSFPDHTKVHGLPNAPRGPTDVGKYSANGYGLYDMAGNVMEWCLDKYDSSFYATSPLRNPVAGVGDISVLRTDFFSVCDSDFRVVRGGAWNSGIHSLEVANRTMGHPGSSEIRSGDYRPHGFRCVREP